MILARGMRNNNPLNIIKSEKINWQGEVKPSTDPNFAQFETLEYGLRTLPSLKPWSMDCELLLSCCRRTIRSMGAGRFGKSWHGGTLKDQR